MGGEFFRKELNINSNDICKNGILYGFELHISDFVNISGKLRVIKLGMYNSELGIKIKHLSMHFQ